MRFTSSAVAHPRRVFVGAIGYALVSVLGHRFLHEWTSTGVVWPSSGFAIALLLVAGWRMWPAVLAGGILSTLYLYPFGAWFGVIPLVTTLEALAARALLVRALKSERMSMDHTPEVLVLIGVSLAVAGVGTVIDIWSITLSHSGGTSAELVGFWKTWWLAKASGVVIVTPVIVAWTQPHRPGTPRAGVAPAIATLVATSALAVLGFVAPWSWGTVTIFATVFVVPLAIWACMRFGARVATLAILILAIVATLGTTAGHGTFAVPQRSIPDRDLVVQIYLLAVAFTCLIITTTVAERDRLEHRQTETQQRLRETLADLQESQSQLATVYDNVTEMLSLWGVDSTGRTRLVSVNRSTLATLGLTRDSPELRGFLGLDMPTALGARLKFLGVGDPETLRGLVDLHTAHLQTVMTSRQPVNYEEVAEFKRGTLVTEISVVPVISADGTITHLLRSARDVTERRCAEESRRQLEAGLQRAQKLEAIGQLAGGIAHDFNNILAGILGHVELAKADMTPATDAREQLDGVERAVFRARGIVNQILTFSRRAELERKPMRTAAVIEETYALLRASVPTNIAIGTRIADAKSTVVADASQLHQVLMNLCTNAIYAVQSHGGRVVISQDAVVLDGTSPLIRDGLSTGRYIRLRVEDDGVGMDEETMSHLFEPFFTTKPQGAGTGLGLSVVHGIVRAHGGGLQVRSVAGEGSRFDAYFPTVDHEPAEEPPPAAATTQPSGERVLLVDDEAAIATVIRRLLERAGYRVSAFQSSVAALAAFEADPAAFDIVISDLTMPDLSGREFASRVAALRDGMPFILTTGYASADFQRDDELVNVRRIMHKPFAASELVRVVREVLHRETDPV